MRIAILSDTHDVLRSQVKEIISTCDAVIHGGDINSQEILDEIQDVTSDFIPCYVVRGNNDKEWAKHLPLILSFEIKGISFLLTHNKKDVPQELGNAEIVIYGHSHKYSEETIDGRLWLNPGSCGRKRFHLSLSMAILHIEDDRWYVEKVNLFENNQKGNNHVGYKQEEIHDIVQEIFRRMDKGQTVDRIAKKMKLDSGFVEEICRIRVTHPGVTPEGVVDKMEVNRIVTK